MAKNELTGGPRSELELLGEISKTLAAFKQNPKHPALIGKPEGNPVSIRPAYPDGATMRNLWTSGASGRGTKWVQGYANPRAVFKDVAIQRKDAWKNGVTQAVAEDAFAKGMSKVNVDEAIATAEAVGGAGWEAGINARANKYERTMTDFSRIAAAAVKTVRDKPATTPEQRETRAVEMIRGMRAAGKAYRGRG